MKIQADLNLDSIIQAADRLKNGFEQHVRQQFPNLKCKILLGGAMFPSF